MAPLRGATLALVIQNVYSVSRNVFDVRLKSVDLNDHHSECPPDRFEMQEISAFEDLGYSFRSPPASLIEDRAMLVASELANLERRDLEYDTNASALPASSEAADCCNPALLDLATAVARGLVQPPPTPGEAAASAALAAVAAQRLEEERKKRGRAVNTVGPLPQALPTRPHWDDGWHYEAPSSCAEPAALVPELSFARRPEEGCARFAVAVGGPLGAGLPRAAAAFEEHVVNPTKGDVDVFFYVSLADLHDPNPTVGSSAAANHLKEQVPARIKSGVDKNSLVAEICPASSFPGTLVAFATLATAAAATAAARCCCPLLPPLLPPPPPPPPLLPPLPPPPPLLPLPLRGLAHAGRGSDAAPQEAVGHGGSGRARPQRLGGGGAPRALPRLGGRGRSWGQSRRRRRATHALLQRPAHRGVRQRACGG